MRLQVDAWPKNLHVGNGSHRDVFIRGRLAAQSVDPSKGATRQNTTEGTVGTNATRWYVDEDSSSISN